MPVTVEKTWEYVVNVVVNEADITTRNTTLMLTLKELLTDTGGHQFIDENSANISNTKPWIVVASSNSSVADSNDNWNSNSDLVWDSEASPHSWIHLRQVDYFGSGDHLNLLISLGPTTSVHQLAYVAWARGADGWQNDGTTTTRPTAEVGVTPIVVKQGSTTSGSIDSSDQMWGRDSTNNQAVLHYRISDDGECGAWFTTIANGNSCFHGWQRGNEDQARNEDWWVWNMGTDSNSDVLEWANVNGTPAMHSLDDSDIKIDAYIGQPIFTLVELRHADYNSGGTGNRFLAQCTLHEDSRLSCYGILTDVWWNSSVNNTGDGSPVTPPVTKRVLGEMVIPWPSGQPMQVA